MKGVQGEDRLGSQLGWKMKKNLSHTPPSPKNLQIFMCADGKENKDTDALLSVAHGWETSDYYGDRRQGQKLLYILYSITICLLSGDGTIIV